MITWETIFVGSSTLQNMELDAGWWDPRNNSLSYITTIKGQEKWLATGCKKEKANDWVLVLKKAESR